MYLLTASLSKTKKKPNIKRQACLFVSQWCLATLISRIYETLLIGSEIKMGNLAAHKFEHQALIASSERKKNVFNLFFWVRNILHRGLIGSLMKMAEF